MNVYQFFTSVITNNETEFNKACSKLTDRMSYLNESLNSITAIQKRMEAPLSNGSKDSIFKAAATLSDYFRKNGESSEDNDKIQNVNYDILTALWRIFNAGAITADNVKLISRKDDKCYDTLSDNEQSNVPGFTVTVYENVGRYLYANWLKGHECEYFRKYMDIVTSTNDPIYRQYFSFVPYLVPAYGTVAPNQAPYDTNVVKAYNETLKYFKYLVEAHGMTQPVAIADGVSSQESEADRIDPDHFVRTINAQLNDYYNSVLIFFHAMLDVYTNDKFSTGVFKLA